MKEELLKDEMKQEIKEEPATVKEEVKAEVKEEVSQVRKNDNTLSLCQGVAEQNKKRGKISKGNLAIARTRKSRRRSMNWALVRGLEK